MRQSLVVILNLGGWGMGTKTNFDNTTEIFYQSQSNPTVIVNMPIWDSTRQGLLYILSTPHLERMPTISLASPSTLTEDTCFTSLIILSTGNWSYNQHERSKQYFSHEKTNGQKRKFKRKGTPKNNNNSKYLST